MNSDPDRHIKAFELMVIFGLGWALVIFGIMALCANWYQIWE